MRLLLTGFAPFRNEVINPSQKLLEVLAGSCEAFGSGASNLSTPVITPLLLPVSYKDSIAVLSACWNDEGPYDALIMMGQAGGRKSVCLERVALNWSETSFADEHGDLRPPGPLHPGKPSAFISDFFPSSWKETLSHEGPTEISFSAGTYVCNSIYFEALSTLCGQGTPALFVHVPYLPEQTLDKPDQASMPFEVQARILRRLIQLVAESI